jgi:hypothetical protein
MMAAHAEPPSAGFVTTFRVRERDPDPQLFEQVDQVDHFDKRQLTGH